MKIINRIKHRLSSARIETSMVWRITRRAFREAWRVSRWRLLLAGALSIINDMLPFLSSFLSALAINELTQAVAGRAVNTTIIYSALIGAVAVTFVVQFLREIQLTTEQNLNEMLESDVVTQLNRQYVSLDLAQMEGSQFQKLIAKSGGRYQYAYRQLTYTLFRLVGYISGLITAALIILSLSAWFLPLLIISVVPAAWVRLRRGLAIDTFWEKQSHDNRLRLRTVNLLQSAEQNIELRLNGSSNYLIDLVTRLQRTHQYGLFGIRRRYSRLEMATSWIEDGVRLGLELLLVGRVLGGQLALGTYTFYSNSFNRFGSSVSGIMREFADLYENTLVMRDIYTILDLKPSIINMPNARILPTDLIPTIEFRDVMFTYPDVPTPVFEHFNMTIEPGQTIALVGENGAGKSTLIKLLARLYDVQAGSILIDGTDLRELDLESWRTNLGVLLQEFNRYPYTARENIELGRIEIAGDTPRLERSIAQANAGPIIAGWPQGLDQPLSKLQDSGVDLSGGQWQRLALARAFYRSAGVLVLDEPTSAVDAQAEAQIFDELMSHQKGKTTIIISHRFSTVRRAARIYVMEKGRIIEQGSHAELMKLKGGTYHRLFELQAEGYR